MGGCSSGKQMEQHPTAFMNIWFFLAMSCTFLYDALDWKGLIGLCCCMGLCCSGRMGDASGVMKGEMNAVC